MRKSKAVQSIHAINMKRYNLVVLLNLILILFLSKNKVNKAEENIPVGNLKFLEFFFSIGLNTKYSIKFIYIIFSDLIVFNIF